MEKHMQEFEKRLEELEIQIEEMRLSRDAAESNAAKLAAFFDFSGTGYFTLLPDGSICDVNCSGAGLFGMESVSLLKGKFKSFLTSESQKVFEDFLRKVFMFKERQICEVRVKIENDISAFIYIEGLASDDRGSCILSATDITDRKLAEETVYSLLSEKEILLKEVHHRVKNNMYNIGALLNMQANAQETPAAKSVLFDAAGRVQSMSVLYDKLYRSEYTGAVSLKEYLPDLVYEIVGIFPQKNSVKIKTQIDDIILDAKILSVLGMLVNELITNSMKYAFKGRNDGVISVTVSRKDKKAVIVIGDNGNGMPESVNFKNSMGFGMQLVSMLTEQIGGSITIERGEGTRFVLEFGI